MTILEFIDQKFPLSILENKEDIEDRFGLPECRQTRFGRGNSK